MQGGTDGKAHPSSTAEMAVEVKRDVTYPSPIMLWAPKLLRNGFSSPIKEDTPLPQLPRSLQSRHLADQARKLWAIELEKHGEEGASLIRVLWAMNRWGLGRGWSNGLRPEAGGL